MTTTTPTLFWAHRTREIADCDDEHAAIEQFLDGRDDLPAEVEVVEYKPTKIRVPDWFARLTEQLAGRYAGDDWEPSENLWGMAHDLETALIAELTQHALLTPTGRAVTVDTADWIKKHRPDWHQEIGGVRCGR